MPPWRKWGCYVSERAWGTVREDYSADGDAWNYLPHDKARSKAYRWGEDGIAGLCDRYQLLIFSPAFWNGRDPILKERMFGLTSSEGNRGEDVKEYYFYLDATPTGSYMKLLYKYPHAEYPYARLVDENRRRGRQRHGVRAARYRRVRRGPLLRHRHRVREGGSGGHLHPRRGVQPRGRTTRSSISCRSCGSATRGAGADRARAGQPADQPGRRRARLARGGWQELIADDSTADSLPNLMFEYELGARHLYAPAGRHAALHRQRDQRRNASMVRRARSASRFTKDAFHRQIVDGEACRQPRRARAPRRACTTQTSVPAGGSTVWHLRLTPAAMTDPLADVETIVRTRRAEADEFYAAIHPPKATDDEKLVQRQALAGMLWTKQIYLFDVNSGSTATTRCCRRPRRARRIRNAHWRHLNSMRILSMPDKWEYPWFAAWDLAFHCVAIALVDPAFAKENLWVLLFEQFQHPNGRSPRTNGSSRT